MIVGMPLYAMNASLPEVRAVSLLALELLLTAGQGMGDPRKAFDGKALAARLRCKAFWQAGTLKYLILVIEKHGFPTISTLKTCASFFFLSQRHRLAVR